MNPVDHVTIAETEITIKVLKNPITATLRSSMCIFEVRCEATQEWLTPMGSNMGYCGEEKKQWKETLKKVEFQFHKVKEEDGYLWITSPVGFWLSDGRLVSPYYEQGTRVKAYWGKENEILSMGRKLVYIKDKKDKFTFLP